MFLEKNNNFFYGSYNGFALAMPATLVLVIVCLGIVPQMLAERYQKGDFYRILAAIVILADVLFYLMISYYYYTKKTMPINFGKEFIMTYNPAVDPRSELIVQLIYQLQAIPDMENFLVLPEGIMLNYMLRKPCPIKYINFMPPEMLIFGERKMLDELQSHPPQYIVLIPKDTREYGVAEFGADPYYGQEIMTWVRQEYETIRRIDMKGSALKEIRILKRAWIKD